LVSRGIASFSLNSVIDVFYVLFVILTINVLKQVKLLFTHTILE